MTEILLMPGVYLRREPQALYVRSATPLAVLSSAVVGGELDWTRHVLNMQVPEDYRGGDHQTDLQRLAAALGITEPFVGVLTAAPVARAQVVIESDGETTVAVVLTAGIGNPTAAGVTAAFGRDQTAGTINILVVVDGRLPHAARANAIITATEAKTLVLVEVGVVAPHGGPATGTSTDAIVVASTERGTYHEYAGPVALVGALIGRAVRRGLQQALRSR